MQWFLVLGATSGIASATAHLLAAKGFNLYLAARTRQEVERIANDIHVRYDVEVRSLEFDALDFDRHRAMYESLDPKPVGVLCAVGYLGNQGCAEIDPAEAKLIMDTNYTACAALCNIIAADFEERRQGAIVVLSSVAGDRARRSNYMYGSAKAALSAYLDGLRLRLNPAGVRVITIKPGFVATKMITGMRLPSILVSSPQKVARDIVAAYERGVAVRYTPWYWRYIMLVVRHLPESIIVRMKN